MNDNKNRVEVIGAPYYALLLFVAFATVGFLGVFIPNDVQASENAAKKETGTEDIRVGLRAGISAFLNSQSYRPPHFIKPTTRVEVGFKLDAIREAGLEIVGTRSENENYSLLGALAFARAVLHKSSRNELNLRGGFGLGSGPRILFKDLSYEQDVIPWGQFGLDMRWKLMPGMHGGAALSYENLSVISLLLSLDFKL